MFCFFSLVSQHFTRRKFEYNPSFVVSYNVRSSFDSKIFISFMLLNSRIAENLWNALYSLAYHFLTNFLFIFHSSSFYFYILTFSPRFKMKCDFVVYGNEIFSFFFLSLLFLFYMHVIYSLWWWNEEIREMNENF